MNYIDLGTVSKNSRLSSRHGNRRWAKSAALILGLTILIFSVKLLIQPVASALGGFWQGSTLLVSNALSGPRALKKDEGVTNILLVGIDRRSSVPYSFVSREGKVEKNGFLADTIIIGSYNHETQGVSLISLPRDLWVKMPAFGNVYEQYTKINAVHAYGDQYDYAGGGIALLQDVLGEILGIPLHYVVRIDFEAFRQVIDDLGGIDLEVERSFDDYLYPREGYEDAPWDERFEHVHFDAGLQHMDGETALKFARSRRALGPEGSDFARARRQQKVILAVRNKTLSAETFLNLERMRQLYLTLSDHVLTNAEFNELPLFYSLGKGVAGKEVKMYVLDGSQSEEGSVALLTHPESLDDYGGAWVLVPRAGPGDYSEIQEFIGRIFYGGTREL